MPVTPQTRTDDGPVRDGGHRPSGLTGDDLSGLFDRCAGARGVLLAVSGGGDSTALAVLYSEWHAAVPGAPAATVASVDHGLRADAAADVEAVAALSHRLGLSFRALRIAAPPPDGDIQAWAREHRYALLAGAARDSGCDVILTAHTIEDQAETFLLRLGRGSGLRGLAAIGMETGLGGDLRLIRPLLGVSRADLRQVLRQRRIGWREDPSNDDRRFARVGIRALMPVLARQGLDVRRLAETATRLGRAADAIDWIVGRAADDAVRIHPGGFALLRLEPFCAWPAEIRLRLLSDLLRWVGCGRYGPRLASLERLAAEIRPNLPAQSLAGALVFGRADHLTICREAGRNGLPAIDLPASGRIVWDGRIRFRRLDDSPAGLTIAPASRAALRGFGREALIDQPGADLDARVLATIPALWRDGVCIAVPALDLWREAAMKAAIRHEFAVPPPAPMISGSGHCGGLATAPGC